MQYNFIIPYRNRKEHLNEFIQRFTGYLQGTNIDAHFYVIHQITLGEFNRGAMKNIGFLEACKVRPDGLFIFHDIDIYPTAWGSIIYDTPPNHIRHPIGSNENLGGICCFWKKEFERVNGFPNYNGWGIEDVTIWYRAKRYHIPIDHHKHVSLENTSLCIHHDHSRSHEKQNVTSNMNTTLHITEEKIGDTSNGLSSLHYEVLCSIDLAPRFTMLNVDFRLS
jgi:hypothetical protein